MYSYEYPHPAVTTDCCIFSFHGGTLSVLLIRRGIDPYKDSWALPGGFMRIDETAEQCALRELREETSYKAERLTQFHAYTSIGRDPRERVITIAYYALVKQGYVHGGDDANDARWFPIDNLPELAFDHSEILAGALNAMRRDIYFEPLGFDLLPDTFSMTELQKIIEAITGNTYDRRNFYNKMRHAELVTEVFDDQSASEIRCCSEPVNAFDSEECRFDMATMEPEEAEFKRSLASSARRTNVRYSFNMPAFLKRKSKKGNTPISF